MSKAKRILTLACVLASVAGCGPKETAVKADSMLLADQFCAGNFQPWETATDACLAEKKNGSPGASCETLGQMDGIIDQRRRASVFKECRGPGAKDLMKLH